MDTLPWITTYFAYVFVVVAYTFKVWKYFKMPNSLRWEIYPIPHEGGKQGSYLEEPEFWTKPQKKNILLDIIDMAKKYLTMNGYFKRVRSYWLGLYPWHLGFYLIVLFDGLILFDAFLMEVADLEIAGGSPDALGVLLYYVTIVVGLSSFILGTIGSIGLLTKRLTDDSLKEFATPQNFFNYVFFLALFVTGLLSYIAYPTLDGFREFWVGVITGEAIHLEAIEWVHVMLFNIFLIYLPMTRSTHYITMPLYYFRVRWNDKLNRNTPEDDNKFGQLVSLQPNWSAAHIQKGASWGEIVSGLPEEEKGDK